MPKIKFTLFKPFETMKAIDRTKACNESHVRITRSMLYSSAFRKLEANDIKIYHSMKLNFYNTFQKNTDFAYTQSLGIKHLGLSEGSGNSVKRALGRLIKYGFIEPTYISKGGGKNSPIPNRFKFSENWKNI